MMKQYWLVEFFRKIDALFDMCNKVLKTHIFRILVNVSRFLTGKKVASDELK